MLNKTGVLAVLDRGVTINWDDGPTLHRITAQVRYHTASMATTQLVRVLATQKISEDPLAFIQEDGLKVIWTWIEGDDGDEATYWVAQLAVTNDTDEMVYLDALDVIRIDSAYSGQLNLGAPTGLWQCARANDDPSLDWEAWSQTTASAGGFTREGLLLVQPVVSNRSHPPALVVRADATDESGHLPVEIRLEMNGERFERLIAQNRADGSPLAPGITMVSTRFMVASGDNALELRGLKAA